MIFLERIALANSSKLPKLDHKGIRQSVTRTKVWAATLIVYFQLEACIVYRNTKLVTKRAAVKDIKVVANPMNPAFLLQLVLPVLTMSPLRSRLTL